MTEIFLEETYKPLVSPQASSARAGASSHESLLWQALEDVEDPEYPVSVVDMGLIYNVAYQDHIAHVDLSFTSMGCPCMEYIIDDVRKRLLEEPIVNEVKLQVVWDPPWTRKRLTEKGAQQLKQWGVAV